MINNALHYFSLLKTFRNNKKWTFFALLLIVLSGALLRFFNLDVTSGWLYDSSRDVLVSKHMVEGDFLLISPHANGGVGAIKNSPFYYLVLAAFWLIVRSPLGMAYMFALFGTLSVIITFFIGKTIKSRGVGLYAAAYVSFGSFFIEQSRRVWQPHLLTFLVLSSLFLIIKLFKTKKVGYLPASITVFFLTLHMHLSFFPFFIIFLWWSCVWMFKNYIKHKNVIVGSVGYTLLHFPIWLQSVDTQNPSGNFFIRVISFFDIGGYISNLIQVLKILGETMFPSTHQLIGLALLLFVISLIYLYKDRYQKYSYPNFLYFLCPLFLIPIYSLSVVQPHYIQAFIPIFIIAIAYMIENIGNKVLRIAIFTLILLTMGIRNKQLILYEFFNELSNAHQISSIIFEDSVKRGLILYRVNQCQNECDCGNEFTPHIYFFLEELSGKYIVKLTDTTSDGFVPVRSDSPIYFVCENYRDNKKVLVGSVLNGSEQYFIYTQD